MPDDTHEMEATETVSGEPIFAVFDIPTTATPEEAARLLNEPYERGCYVHNVFGSTLPGYATRVIVKRATRSRAANPTVQETSTVNLAPATKEARAIQFLRDNREMTAKQLAAAFKALGVIRSEGWIAKKRVEVVRTERRIG